MAKQEASKVLELPIRNGRAAVLACAWQSADRHPAIGALGESLSDRLMPNHTTPPRISQAKVKAF
jgi:hypothetical protein